MDDLMPEVQWLSIQEAAEIKGVTPSAISHALTLHPNIKEKYTKKVGKRLYLSKEGFTVLYNVQNKAQGGAKPMKDAECAFTDHSLVKQKIAEMAVDFASDPIIAMRMEQLKQRNEIDDLKAFKEQFQPMLEDATPVNVTASQRQFLNERVRGLAIRTNMPFNIVWGWVHDAVGIRHVEDYKFEDYPVAIKYLKRLFSQYGLSW